MKEYIKPDLEYIEFSAEAITDADMSAETGVNGGGL